MYFRFCFAFIATLTLILAGCSKRERESKAVSFEQEPTDYTLMIIADIKTIQENPRAFDFVTYALDHYFKERVGTNDQVIISQLSGSNPLIFQGNPRSLREEIGSAEDFRNFIVSRSSAGRKVNDGVAASLKYLSRTSGVKRGGAVPVVLIVSSMIDGEPESKESEDRVMEALIKYGQSGGHLAYYFCDQTRIDAIEARMKLAGFGDFTTLECDVHGRPPLPTFHR